MNSFKDEIRKMRTELLQEMLRADLDGSVPLDMETVILICDVLAERRPPDAVRMKNFDEFIKEIMKTDQPKNDEPISFP